MQSNGLIYSNLWKGGKVWLAVTSCMCVHVRACTCVHRGVEKENMEERQEMVLLNYY